MIPIDALELYKRFKTKMANFKWRKPAKMVKNLGTNASPVLPRGPRATILNHLKRGCDVITEIGTFTYLSVSSWKSKASHLQIHKNLTLFSDLNHFKLIFFDSV